MTNPRVRFVFDDCPVPGGSHHQKYVVVDGTHAFVGGMDVCESRWDDRCHRGENPLRASRNRRVLSEVADTIVDPAWELRAH